MLQLGYNKYFVQGGDWGAGVVRDMALQFPDHVLALHTNMPIPSGPPKDFDPKSLNEDEIMNFKIYPNPSTGQFEIQLPSSVGELSVEVYDMSGRKVLGDTFANTSFVQLNLNANSGIYLVKIFIKFTCFIINFIEIFTPRRLNGLN